MNDPPDQCLDSHRLLRLLETPRQSVELATLEWVAWYNHHRLMEPLGYIPPAEAEANSYRQLRNAAEVPALT